VQKQISALISRANAEGEEAQTNQSIENLFIELYVMSAYASALRNACQLAVKLFVQNMQPGLELYNRADQAFGEGDSRADAEQALDKRLHDLFDYATKAQANVSETIAQVWFRIVVEVNSWKNLVRIVLVVTGRRFASISTDAPKLEQRLYPFRSRW
jgi:hypothetical protein